MSIILESSIKNTLSENYPNSFNTDDSVQLSEIHKKNVNISIWERKLNNKIIESGKYMLDKNSKIQFSEVIKPKNTLDILKREFGHSEEYLFLFKDISKLVKIFCELFEENRAWLRLDAISKPMCPRFHTDYVRCRLVTTYVGPGTQWLPHHLVNRSKLGHGNQGQPDDKSGLFQKNVKIEQLEVGHVAMLKGESWDGNDGAGLVHRSPHAEKEYKRLYMTIDFLETYLNIYRNYSKSN